MTTRPAATPENIDVFADSANRSIAATLLPIITSVFVAYLVIGLAMPVLPVHVHDGLRLGTFVVGVVAGAQFSASLISRFWSGNYADSRGGKSALIVGLVVATFSGVLYLVSFRFMSAPVVSVGILLLGRALLGGAESFIVSGALVWGMALVGPRNIGKVMSWVGTAMYVAFAVGAPAGTMLYARYGFVAIGLATTVIPLLTLLLVVPRKTVAPRLAKERPSFTRVVGDVWLPGVGLAFCSVGFGAITTFIVLLFGQHGWGQGWLALTGLSGAFILARLIFGHLPDRMGGAKIALIFVVIEAAGQALIWLAPRPAVALLGAMITGFGYSLVYPAFGVEAVHRAPAESRGLATGAYTAFLDLALGIANPALGWIAAGVGLRSVYLTSAIVVMCAAAIALRLLRA